MTEVPWQKKLRGKKVYLTIPGHSLSCHGSHQGKTLRELARSYLQSKAERNACMHACMLVLSLPSPSQFRIPAYDHATNSRWSFHQNVTKTVSQWYTLKATWSRWKSLIEPLLLVILDCVRLITETNYHSIYKNIISLSNTEWVHLNKYPKADNNKSQKLTQCFPEYETVTKSVFIVSCGQSFM